MHNVSGNRAVNNKIRKIPFPLELTFEWEETGDKRITVTVIKGREAE